MKRRSFIAGLAACAMLARESMSILGVSETPEDAMRAVFDTLTQAVREAWTERYRRAYFELASGGSS
mgnify:CR=1 FL=1